MKVGTELVKIPSGIVKGVKEGVKDQLKPAQDMSKVFQSAIGGVSAIALEPIIEKGLTYLFAALNVDTKQDVYKALIKVGAPIGVAAAAIASKVPTGNLIATSCAILSITSAIRFIYNFVKGKRSDSSERYSADSDLIAGMGFASF